MLHRSAAPAQARESSRGRHSIVRAQAARRLGRLPSRRWRSIAWAAVLVLAIVTVGGMLNPKMDTSVKVKNPIGIEGAGNLIDSVVGVAFLLLIVIGLLSAWSLFQRYRRSDGDDRQQIKWFALAAAILIGWLVVTSIGQAFGITWLYESWFNTLVSGLAFLAIPVAVAVAILKYQLYEIDVVIRKTVVVGVLAAFITVVYVAIVVGIGAVAAGSVSNRFLPIVAAVVIAVAFQPVQTAQPPDGSEQPMALVVRARGEEQRVGRAVIGRTLAERERPQAVVRIRIPSVPRSLLVHGSL